MNRKPYARRFVRTASLVVLCSGAALAGFNACGNVWELADSINGDNHYRGGAFNCSNSELYHRCEYDGTWGPSARGLRCCKDLP